jgi:hypothetical protein
VRFFFGPSSELKPRLLITHMVAISPPGVGSDRCVALTGRSSLPTLPLLALVLLALPGEPLRMLLSCCRLGLLSLAEGLKFASRKHFCKSTSPESASIFHLPSGAGKSPPVAIVEGLAPLFRALATDKHTSLTIPSVIMVAKD